MRRGPGGVQTPRPQARTVRSMRYIPLTDSDTKEMLEKTGFSSVTEIFDRQIPERVRVRGLLPIDPPVSEMELQRLSDSIAAKRPGDLISFLGAGCYDHYTPAAIEHLVSRGEFATAYTPYQPEIAQGTLIGAYEFQTYMAMLTGMEIANSSMYDAATGAAEAVLMAHRLTRRRRFLVSAAVHPHYLETIRTFVSPLEQIEIVTIPHDPKTGRTGLAALKAALGPETGGIVVQSPNIFGVIEDWKAVSEANSGSGALFIAITGDPLSLALLSPPGEFGADIVVGEAQGLGLPPFFGGPNVGIFCCKKEYVRQMPGRLVGETVDQDGRRAFVLTLTTREQFIRREKATSNICTSQQLCALWVTVYCSLMGKHGLKELSRQNLSLAQSLKKRLLELPGVKPAFSGPTFNEFTLRLPVPARDFIRKAEAQHLAAGVDLGALLGPAHANDLLLCTTERHQQRHHDALVNFAKEVLK